MRFTRAKGQGGAWKLLAHTNSRRSWMRRFRTPQKHGVAAALRVPRHDPASLANVRTLFAQRLECNKWLATADERLAAAATHADRCAVGEECSRRKGILKELDALRVPTSELEFRRFVAGASVDAHGVPGLLPKLRIVPLNWLEPRVAKHDVVLRENSLRAVQAEQTVLTLSLIHI